jgi:hypothetical protein
MCMCVCMCSYMYVRVNANACARSSLLRCVSNVVCSCRVCVCAVVSHAQGQRVHRASRDQRKLAKSMYRMLCVDYKRIMSDKFGPLWAMHAQQEDLSPPHTHTRGAGSLTARTAIQARPNEGPNFASSVTARQSRRNKNLQLVHLLPTGVCVCVFVYVLAILACFESRSCIFLTRVECVCIF